MCVVFVKVMQSCIYIYIHICMCIYTIHLHIMYSIWTIQTFCLYIEIHMKIIQTHTFIYLYNTIYIWLYIIENTCMTLYIYCTYILYMLFIIHPDEWRGTATAAFWRISTRRSWSGCGALCIRDIGGVFLVELW